LWEKGKGHSLVREKRGGGRSAGPPYEGENFQATSFEGRVDLSEGAKGVAIAGKRKAPSCLNKAPPGGGRELIQWKHWLHPPRGTLNGPGRKKAARKMRATKKRETNFLVGTKRDSLRPHAHIVKPGGEGKEVPLDGAGKNWRGGSFLLQRGERTTAPIAGLKMKKSGKRTTSPFLSDLWVRGGLLKCPEDRGEVGAERNRKGKTDLCVS